MSHPALTGDPSPRVAERAAARSREASRRAQPLGICKGRWAVGAARGDLPQSPGSGAPAHVERRLGPRPLRVRERRPGARVRRTETRGRGPGAEAPRRPRGRSSRRQALRRWERGEGGVGGVRLSLGPPGAGTLSDGGSRSVGGSWGVGGPRGVGGSEMPGGPRVPAGPGLSAGTRVRLGRAGLEGAHRMAWPRGHREGSAAAGLLRRVSARGRRRRYLCGASPPPRHGSRLPRPRGREGVGSPGALGAPAGGPRGGGRGRRRAPAAVNGEPCACYRRPGKRGPHPGTASPAARDPGPSWAQCETLGTRGEGAARTPPSCTTLSGWIPDSAWGPIHGGRRGRKLKRPPASLAQCPVALGCPAPCPVFLKGAKQLWVRPSGLEAGWLPGWLAAGWEGVPAAAGVMAPRVRTQSSLEQVVVEPLRAWGIQTETSPGSQRWPGGRWAGSRVAGTGYPVAGDKTTTTAKSLLGPSTP